MRCFEAISLVLNNYLAPKLGKVYHLKGYSGISGAISQVKIDWLKINLYLKQILKVNVNKLTTIC